MKKLFYSLMFLGMAGATFAQPARDVPNKLKAPQVNKYGNGDEFQKPSTDVLRPQLDFSRGDAFWTSDFSDDSEWTSFNSSIPVPIDWDIITDVTAAPAGSTFDEIMLPTASNGFAFINADPGGDGSSQNATIHTVNPIDLTGIENVAVAFNHCTRNFSSSYFVVYSLDGGATWNDVPVSSAPPTGNTAAANTDNPEEALVPLPAEVGNQPEVWIGFRYEADWGWFWAVDDVALVGAPENWLTLNEAYYGVWAEFVDPNEDNFATLLGPDIDMVKGYEYAFYSQEKVRPLTFSADVTNVGSQTQTNVTFTVTLTDPEGTPYTYTESIATLAPQARTNISIVDVMPEPFHLDDDQTDAILGTYTLSFSIEQDEEDFLPESNVVADKTFTVSEDFMSHNGGDSYGFRSDLQGSDCLNISRFAYDEPGEINFIEFALTTGDVDPELLLFQTLNLNVFTGSLYEEPEAPNDEIINLFDVDENGNSDLNYFITDTAIFNADPPLLASETQWVRVYFPEPVVINPDLIYNAELAVGVPPEGVPIDFLWPLFGAGNPESSSFWIGPFNGENTRLFIGGTGFTIRLGNDASVNTNDVNAEPVTFRLGQNYPNPVKGGETLIEWELLEPAKNITFTVHDAQGRVVDQRNFGDRPAGKQEIIRLNADMAAGVYQYSLVVGNYRAVRKMVVTK